MSGAGHRSRGTAWRSALITRSKVGGITRTAQPTMRRKRRVENHRDGTPTMLRATSRDVRRPPPIQPSRGKAAPDALGRVGERCRAVGRHHKAPPPARPEAGGAHQPRRPAATHGDAAGPCGPPRDAGARRSADCRHCGPELRRQSRVSTLLAATGVASATRRHRCPRRRALHPAAPPDRAPSPQS